jgi:hypothetical protein
MTKSDSDEHFHQAPHILFSVLCSGLVCAVLCPISVMLCLFLWCHLDHADVVSDNMTLVMKTG